MIRIIKRLSIWYEPLWLWVIKCQYAIFEKDGSVSERAW